MVPRLSRRRLLSGLSIVGVAAVAGCTSTPGGSADDPTDTTTANTTDSTTEQSTTEDESSDASASDAAAMVRTYVRNSAENPLAAQQYFHPVHPFHPDNLSEEKAEQLLSTDGELDELEVDAEQRDVSAETVLAVSLLRIQEVERSAVADALDGQQTAVVDVTTWMADGRRDHYEIVTVTRDGEWMVLAQAVDTEAPDAPFEGRVVSDVTFDTETDTARVYFDESPSAEQITAKAVNRRSSRSSSTPDVISYFDVRLDPAGDELLVTATVDGETRPIHREQYPPSERAVDGIEWKEKADNPLGPVARVNFTDRLSAEDLLVESTLAGSEATTSPPENVHYLTVGLNAGGDEVTVTLTRDGESVEVHRERHVL